MQQSGSLGRKEESLIPGNLGKGSFVEKLCLNWSQNLKDSEHEDVPGDQPLALLASHSLH